MIQNKESITEIRERKEESSKESRTVSSSESKIEKENRATSK
jgi:hypothetical protein